MASSLNLAVMEAVPASLVVEGASPIALAKALKNEQELQVRKEKEEMCCICIENVVVVLCRRFRCVRLLSVESRFF